MRRLYSSFARGAPGAGLLLLRLGSGAVLLSDAAASFSSGAPASWLALSAASLAAGVLLLIGLWTPVAGVVAAALALWLAFAGRSDPGLHVLSSVLGVALALLGPGGWSVDARLFGWKRFEIRDRDTTPESDADSRTV